MNWIEHDAYRALAVKGKLIDFNDFKMKSDLPGLPIAAIGFWGLLAAYFVAHIWPDFLGARQSYLFLLLWALLVVGFLMYWQNVRARRDAYAEYMKSFDGDRLEQIWGEAYRYPSTLSSETTDAAKREIERRRKG